MNYTEKYHLPQWEESDREMRTDINSAMANLESGMVEAKSAADNAQNTADTALAHKNYVVGRYKGTRESQTIDVGFPPSMVIIHCMYSGSEKENSIGTCSLHFRNYSYGDLDFTETGFLVESDPLKYYPCVNWENRNYIYIAFR